MQRALLRIRASLIFLHRWMGVALSGIFAVWFASGFVMMYWSYPRIDPADRLARASPLDTERISLSPAQALARLQDLPSPSRVVITMLDGRPAYRFFNKASQRIVFADDGDLLEAIPEDMGRRIAAVWTGQPVDSARFEGTIREADQWTVNGVFRAHGKLLKFAWPDGQEVYVSPGTAEVVQHTTRGSRIGAYFGAIPHWFYIAPLRRERELWGSVVIWTSGLGTVVSILGLIVGISRYSPSKRYRTRDGRASFPYVGRMRWHAILGLVFGWITCSWAFSGMMSMDPFPSLTQSSVASPQLAEALRSVPIPIATFAEKPPREALAQAAELKTKELEMLSFGGEPVYLAVEAPGVSRVIPMHGPPVAQLDQSRLLSVLRRASRPYEIKEVRAVTEHESYYVDRHNRLPLPALFIGLSDAQYSAYYIDPRTARVITSYNSSSRWDRWLFQGLHSIDLPWLYRYRPVWDFLVITLLAGGSTLCFTSLVIGWRVLRRII